MSTCVVRGCEHPKTYKAFCEVHWDWTMCSDCWEFHCPCCECDESIARHIKEIEAIEAMEAYDSPHTLEVNVKVEPGILHRVANALRFRFR
jgi:hypothetical protein